MNSFIFCTLLAVSFGNSVTAAPTVDDKVYKDLSTDGTATVILHFNGPKTTDLLAQFREEHQPFERAVHHDVLPDLLEANANRHQAQTLEFLKSRKMSKSSGSDYFQLWLLNQLIVKNIDEELLEHFMSSNEITRVEGNKKYQMLLPPVPANGPVPPPTASVYQYQPQWGVKDVGAPEVWAKGITGRGVVVGVIDTGLRASHEALRKNYRASFGWYDAVATRPEAYDDQGHGTHCSGSVLGQNGIGVAPDATLISCKALDANGAGTDSQFRACGQFMACPTDATGNNRDCSQKPKVISNSWGYKLPTAFFNDIIDVWVSNGQIAIVAAGNAGPGCSTTNSPADYGWAIGIGAVDVNGKVAWFSSRGPAPSNNRVKPDVSGPGVDIISASHLYDNMYRGDSGTSMATPHVAGVAALFAQANSTLTQKDVYALLIQGAKQTTPTNQTCGGIPDSQYPNNAVGYGKVYAPAAFA